MLFGKFFFLCIAYILTFNINAYASDSTKYNEARKNYASTIGRGNKTAEIKYLKQLIIYGRKLNKNVIRYKKELRRLDKHAKIPRIKKPKKIKSKYSIQSIDNYDDKIVIYFNKKISKKDIRYFTKKGKGNYQYIFDLKGRFKDAKPTKLELDNVNRVKVVQYRFRTLRISLVNKYRLKPIYIIGAKKLTIKLKEIKKLKKTYKQKYQYISRNKTIVIDAGHGGKDAGAVGPRRRYEKHVVLAISKYLYKELRRNGYNVFLTRSRDKYISLRYRTKLANKKKADIFISIHANAARKKRAKKAKGIETYFLSPARSKRAKRVAAKENRSDVGSMGWSSKATFLTALNQGKITASNKMAIDIQKNMLYSLRRIYGNKTIRDGGVREGPFWVLVGAQMPSVLIEVGYISHPSESRRIYTKQYQKTIAKAISKGVDSYFLKNQ